LLVVCLSIGFEQRGEQSCAKNTFLNASNLGGWRQKGSDIKFGRLQAILKTKRCHDA
jgi:hypothetical protein